MAKKPETTFIESVHRHLPANIHREKMNNPYSSGTADVWYSGCKNDLWLEYKFLPRVPQRGIVDPAKLLSALQVRWLNGRYDEGRTVGVCIGCPDGGIILRYREWGHEILAKDFVDRLCSRKDLAFQIEQITTR